jgi:hypothetical protein
VTDNGKPSSLLRYGNKYCRKKFYSTGPRGVSLEMLHSQKLASLFNEDFNIDPLLEKSHLLLSAKFSV